MIAFKTDITEKGIHNCSFIFTHSSNHSQMHLFGFHNHLNKKKINQQKDSYTYKQNSWTKTKPTSTKYWLPLCTSIWAVKHPQPLQYDL